MPIIRCAVASIALIAAALLASCGVPKNELPPFGPIERPLFGCPSMQGVYLWDAAPPTHDGFVGTASTGGKSNSRPKQLWLRETSLNVELRSRDINLSPNLRSAAFRDWNQRELMKSRCTAGMLGVGVNTRLARMRDGGLAVGVLSSQRGAGGASAWSWVQLRRIGEGDVAPAPLDASLAGDSLAPRDQATPSQRQPVTLESLLPPASRDAQPASTSARSSAVEALIAPMSQQRRFALMTAALIAGVMLFFAAVRAFGERRTVLVMAAAWLAVVVSYFVARLSYYGGAALMAIVPATFALGLLVLFAIVFAYRVYAAFFFPSRITRP